MSRRRTNTEDHAATATAVVELEAPEEPQAPPGNWKITFNTRYSPWLPLTVIVHGARTGDEARQELFSLIDRSIVEVGRVK